MNAQANENNKKEVEYEEETSFDEKISENNIIVWYIEIIPQIVEEEMLNSNYECMVFFSDEVNSLLLYYAQSARIKSLTAIKKINHEKKS